MENMPFAPHERCPDCLYSVYACICGTSLKQDQGIDMAEKVKHTDLSWCAGVLESEGWITICTRRAKDRTNLRFKLIIGVTNSDLGMLTPFVALWGGRLRPRRGTALTRKQCFEWRVEETLKLNSVYALLRPMFAAKSASKLKMLFIFEIRSLLRSALAHLMEHSNPRLRRSYYVCQN